MYVCVLIFRFAQVIISLQKIIDRSRLNLVSLPYNMFALNVVLAKIPVNLCMIYHDQEESYKLVKIKCLVCFLFYFIFF